ncbi:MAG: YCF48-related protein [Lewinella sp.]
MTYQNILPLALVMILFACDEDKPTLSDWRETTISAAELTDIAFLNANIGLVSGTTGTLLLTEDGGQSWAPLEVGTTESLVAVYALDPETFYTARNGLYTSADAGRTFHQLGASSLPESTIFDIHFFSKEEGVVVSAGTVYATGNGGDSWVKTCPSGSTGKLLEVADNQTLYLAGGFTSDMAQNGSIQKSSDRGESWQLLPLPAGLTESEVTAIDFLSDRVGFAATFAHQLFGTTDGGLTWTELGSVGNAPVSDIEFESPTDGFLLSGTKIYTTRDGGNRWSVSYTASEELFRLDRTGDGTYAAIGRNGLLLKNSPN